MGYGRVVVAAIGLVAAGYAAAALHPDVYHVVREHTFFPETRFGAALSLGLMGGALGMFLALGLAPPAFLRSPAGRWWVEGAGRGGPGLFRAEMLALAGFVLFVSAVVYGSAFLDR